MAQTYKVSGVRIETSATWSGIYTCPASATALVNSIYLSNRRTDVDTAVSVRVHDNSHKGVGYGSSSYYLMTGVLLPMQATLQPLSAPLVLESEDYLQAGAASGIVDVIVNILEIT